MKAKKPEGEISAPMEWLKIVLWLFGIGALVGLVVQIHPTGGTNFEMSRVWKYYLFVGVGGLFCLDRIRRSIIALRARTNPESE